MSKYERFNEEYPDPDALSATGQPIGYGQFGYPDYCQKARDRGESVAA
jgi:hypothetical protein